ncbi:putative ubiquitin conjugating enzyme [Aspergillus alliaceus]|uniref:putative ubiquitin conjugating enzyme n=1 Tax=Petromyces alliaceus TaxID=209559 RepID=UPI0012A54ECE|nr:uncharacterized protein BDW43DRAFT_306544 [Aspergillus alliaceus]KAB8238698.1 hypothetical protein BDW43DRAFT_306544 [Aspergillus alliaceus]
MPRKDFQRDLAQASVPGRFPRLRNVRPGEEHGSILFTYMVPFSSNTIDLQTSIFDTYDYPDDHTYFTFAASDNIPEAVSQVLDSTQPVFAGFPIHQFLECVSDSIDDALLGNGSAHPIQEDDATESETPSDDDNDDWDVDYGSICLSTPDRLEVLKQIRSDMGAVKKAGYRVGFIGEVTESLIISISCRIAKLAISKVAMQAWNVHPTQYLVLLLRYPLGYRQLEEIVWTSPSRSPQIRMRVGLCDSYKPGVATAIQAFDSTDSEIPGKVANQGPDLQSFFIGDSIHTLLNTHFVSLVRQRLQHNFTWTGAELYSNNSQGKMADPEELTRELYFVRETWNDITPRFLRADHISEGKAQLSFPLIAMQFTLRRFVKCTEFCLNCYCKVEAGFEALMPYVCSKSLCLYQYMKLGMGPSLEWKIVSQPYVIDMLVSFTYSRAAYNRLQDFPTGLGMVVPTAYGKRRTERIYSAKLNLDKMELLAEGKPDLREGDWIMITRHGSNLRTCQPQWHCRVQDADLLPSIVVSSPVTRWALHGHSPPFTSGDLVQFVCYKECFDDLPDNVKCEAMVMLLDTLPNIDEMRSFVLSHPNANSKRSLASWGERISPSALYALRWIVASNRSCIRYEDNPEHQISGLEGYAQFRLAQGAPDKEQRFVSAVRSQPSSQNQLYPTLFAWHGSPLYNWHSILREGLHFKTVAHGRSSGDGVYMSPQFNYSVTYASQGSASLSWPNSILNIQMALSLNEVVNAPMQFVTCNGYYVVDQLDWIQPRYLIIAYKNECLKLGESGVKPSDFYTQDPGHAAVGPNSKRLILPISAVSSHHKALFSDISDSQSRSSNFFGRATQNSTPDGQLSDDGILLSDEDPDSVATLADDYWLLESEGQESDDSNDSDNEATNEDLHGLSETDFRPGSLDESSLKLLGPPQYATTLATKSLQKHLQATLKLQEREPLHTLGWYVNPNMVNNVYQWIVELHSFEPSLPLAKDLKEAGLTSVVLELRFLAQFPMSPPFVRVIRPRFLPFSRGGGGHVTAGGAMCLELLTSSGWSPASSIESVLLQVRMALTSTDPVPARLEKEHTLDYSVGEAVSAYVRVCRLHGWKVPDDLIRVSW